MAKRKRKVTQRTVITKSTTTLGSPPEVHLRGAREAVKAARFWLREARRDITAGKCGSALNSLVTAERMAAVVTTERRGAGKQTAFQIDTLRRAESRFARACVKR